MGTASLDGYKSATLCAEIIRRLKNGESLNDYDVLSGRKLTFWGKPREEHWRYGVKEGSQRYIALRTLFTGKELMKHIQDRILHGDLNAYNEYVWALKTGKVAIFTRT